MSQYSLVAGTQCYKYTLKALISNPANSQNDVWLAHDQTTGTDVALKIIAGANHDVTNRLYEARVGAKLSHINLCEVVRADVVDIPHAVVNGAPAAGPFVLIGFRYQVSGPCTRYLTGPGVLSVSSVHKLLLDVLAGLEYLHEQGLQHNDIKPANILVGDNGRFLLTDYGIVWTTASPGIAPFYMPHVPPESLLASPTGYTNNHYPSVMTDIYQLGLTAYRLLNGSDSISGAFQAHHAAGTLDTYFTEVQKGNIPDRSSYIAGVPHRLKQVINKAMSVNPADRYGSALAMRREVEKLHYPYCWTFDASNASVLEKAGKRFSFETVPNGKRFDVSVVVEFESGHKERPKSMRARSVTWAAAQKHIGKCMLELLTQ